MNTRTLADPHLARRRYRAPAADGAALAQPPADTWETVWQSNLALAEQYRLPIDRASARRELVHAAQEYTRQYRDIPPSHGATEIVMAGHQPALIHPGVWFKNFVLAELAERFAATPIHLIIDNDVLSSTSLRVPGGTATDPRWEPLPFDRLERIVPYEAALIADPACFAGFGLRVERALAAWIPRPLIRTVWPDVLSEYERTRNIGRAFAAARHRLEPHRPGATLELPLSTVCQTSSFQTFAAEILSRIEEFVPLHNRILTTYRQVNRVRSQTHPVPDLRRAQDEFESPFWVWTADNPTRRRLFVRPSANAVEFSDHHGWSARLARARLAAGLGDLAHTGIAIRPRALVTTAYARLVLSDLFLHGIGGAKYDEITDRLIQDFFHHTPHEFLTLTATFRLPLPRADVDEQDVRELRDRLRSIRYHPETIYAAAEITPSIAERIERKKFWIHSVEPERRGERHRALASINQQLAAGLTPQANHTRRRIAELERGLQAQANWGSREFAFPLFPEAIVQQLAALARPRITAAIRRPSRPG